MKKVLFIMVVALAAVGCCKQEATVIGAWETQTPCGKKQVMVLEEDGTAKLCPNKCIQLEKWTKVEDKLILSGQRFCKEDSAMVAFTDSMSIVKLSTDSLQLATSCGKTLNYAHLICEKSNCKDEKTCCKENKDGCNKNCSEEKKCCNSDKQCCQKGEKTCSEKQQCCDKAKDAKTCSEDKKCCESK